MSGILFFIFASCHPLNELEGQRQLEENSQEHTLILVLLMDYGKIVCQKLLIGKGTIIFD